MQEQTQTIEVFVDPYEDVVARFIKEDQQRLTDLRVFTYLQEAEPYNIERAARAILADLKREGKKMSPAMTNMLYKYDAKTDKLLLQPDLVAMAKHYNYRIRIKMPDRLGNLVEVGLLHHKGSIFSRTGEMLKVNKLKAIAETSARMMNTKKKESK